MAVIKSAKAAGMVKDAIVLDLGDLDRQARTIVQQARHQADQIITQARTEARRLVDSATEAGRTEGLGAGRTEGVEIGRREGHEAALLQFSAQLEQMILTWTQTLSQWEKDRHEMLMAASEDVLAFALAMGERVVHRIAQIDPTIIEDQLAEALALLIAPSAVSVVIHPDDRSTVDAVLPGLMQRLAQCKHVHLVEDRTIAPGGCVVMTLGGRIDATLQTQIDRIVQTLLPDAPPAAEPSPLPES